MLLLKKTPMVALRPPLNMAKLTEKSKPLCATIPKAKTSGEKMKRRHTPNVYKKPNVNGRTKKKKKVIQQKCLMKNHERNHKKMPTRLARALLFTQCLPVNMSHKQPKRNAPISNTPVLSSLNLMAFVVSHILTPVARALLHNHAPVELLIQSLISPTSFFPSLRPIHVLL